MVRGNSQLIYFVFDLLFLDGLDLRAMPLYERKRRLAPLLTGHDSSLRYSDHIHGQGRTVFETACRRGLEGLIAKLADGKYVAGRNRNWVKVKCHRRQEFVIGGFTDPAGSRRGLGALLLGVYENRQGRRRFMYVGRVGTGFSEARLSHLHRVLGKLERPHSPFINPPTGRDAQGVHWVTPKLVAEIQFSEWTQEGLLRHPSFLGLRDDKPARTIVRELPNHHPTGIMNPNVVAAMPGGRQQSILLEWVKPADREADPPARQQWPAFGSPIPIASCMPMIGSRSWIWHATMKPWRSGFCRI